MNAAFPHMLKRADLFQVRISVGIALTVNRQAFHLFRFIKRPLDFKPCEIRRLKIQKLTCR